jgi:hypothetical protein
MVFAPDIASSGVSGPSTAPMTQSEALIAQPERDSIACTPKKTEATRE